MTRSDFWRGAVTDPRTGGASSARLAGLLAMTAACAVALVGVATRQDVVGVVSALVAGGAVPILSRTKACATTAAVASAAAPAGGADAAQ